MKMQFLPAIVALVLQGDPGAVSYSRRIAPVFALHCNRCHGDEGEAGGFSTGSHRALLAGGNRGNDVVPGDPDGSGLVQYIEGRRGEQHRMPLQAPPLEPGQIETIRRWIAQGAREDRPPKPPRVIGKRTLTIGSSVEIACDPCTPGYVMLSISAGDRQLLTRRAATKGEPVTWPIAREADWPDRVHIELAIAYAGRAKDARLSITNRTVAVGQL